MHTELEFSNVKECTPALFGSRVVSAKKWKLPEFTGTVFMFYDLSPTLSGIFRLKFTVFDLTNAVNEAGLELCTVYSDPMTVYKKSNFPGMLGYFL
jgi:hypothetical protein